MSLSSDYVIRHFILQVLKAFFFFFGQILIPHPPPLHMKEPLRIYCQFLTLKKVIVDPSLTAPYSILVCFARSSAESMGDSIRSTVKKAARLAV